MLVTLYISGTPVSLTLSELSYSALKTGVRFNRPDLYVGMPSWQNCCLYLSFKETKDTVEKSGIIIPAQKYKNEFAKLWSTWEEVSICLVVTVAVYKFGKNMFADRSELLFSENYVSSAPINSFIERCNKHLAFSLKGKTMEGACFDENGAPFSANQLCKPSDTHLEYFIAPDQGPYSQASIPLLLTKVAFPEVVISRAIKLGRKRRFNEATTFLDLFTDTLPAETPLQVAIQRARANLRPAEWAKRVDACVDGLLLLNKHIGPQTNHSDGARRLVINEVVKQITVYTDGTFAMGEPQNSEEDCDGQFLGWGSLDYVVSDKAVIVVRGAENEDGTDWSYPRSPEESGDEEGVGEDAKKLLDDAGLAVGGCQCHDLLMSQPEANNSVTLILCTGHRWRHFLLQRDARGSDAKPLLTYLGETSMRVLRSPVASREARGGGASRSCCYWDELKVSRAKVENVMLALLCSTTHTSLEATVSTTTAATGSNAESTLRG